VCAECETEIKKLTHKITVLCNNNFLPIAVKYQVMSTREPQEVTKQTHTSASMSACGENDPLSDTDLQ